MKRSPLAVLAFGLGSVLGGSVFFPSCGGTSWGGGSCSDPCGNGKLCDTVLGCVDCRGNGDCGAASPFCVLGSCRECATSNDCGTQQACYPKDHSCQPACVTNADCPDDEPLCNPNTGACHSECIDDSNCGAAEPFCSPTGKCGECANNGHCGAAQPICDPKDGECRECAVDSNCASNQVCNDHHCVLAGPCQGNADCGGDTPVCDDGDCVECVVNADCGNGNRPFCSLANTCEECLETADCDPGKVCDAELKCN